ncbi:DUF397 domain-containing protein [Streptomyces sp. NPDC091281]|uniref:DUF397 domain-containing protein n=1 Tax=Streptomyces sp. NPDC091281 TaxID=3365985 RepID=UPI00380682BD
MSDADGWQKSSHSGGGDGSNCVELRATGPTLHLRESDTPGAVLTAAPAALAHLLEALHRSALS